MSGKEHTTYTHTDRQIVCGMIRQIVDRFLASVRHDLVTNSDPSWGMLGSIWGDLGTILGPSGAPAAV